MIVCLVLCGNLSSCASFWGRIVFVRSFPRSWKEGRGSGRYNVCEELSWIVQRVMIWQRTKSKHGKKKGSIREKRFCPTHFCENTTHPLGNLTPPPPPKKDYLILFTYQTCQVSMACQISKMSKGYPFLSTAICSPCILVLLGCDLYTINLLDNVSWQNPSLRAHGRKQTQDDFSC